MSRFALIILTFFCAFCMDSSVFARDWWKESSVSDSLDQREVSKLTGGPAIRQNSSLVPVENAVRVNWVDKYIEVVGGGTADMSQTINMAHALTVAKKTARHLAYEKLAETIRGIQINADATYDRELMQDSNLRTKVNALVLGALVIDETHEQFADGSIMAQVRLGIRIVGSDSLMSGTVESFGQQGASSLSPVPSDYTGVIVLASGQKLKPAMTPRLVGVGGEILYGYKDVSREYLVKYGMVNYARSLDQARQMERIGKNPLILQASNVSGEYQCDLVLPREEALKLTRYGTPALTECRVVFVVD